MKKIVEIRLPKAAIQVTDHSFQLAVETYDESAFNSKFLEHLEETLGVEEGELLVERFYNDANKRVIMKQLHVRTLKDVPEKLSQHELEKLCVEAERKDWK